MKKKSVLLKLRSWLSFIFPQRCCFCGKVIDSNLTCCDECRKKMPRITGELCRCGRPFPECSCKKYSFRFNRAIAAVYYDGVAKRGIWMLKFHGKSHAAKAMAEYMAVKVLDEYDQICFDVISYVPMTTKEENRRGYNQARLLAQQLSVLLKIPCESVLHKTRETASQHQMRGQQRWCNIRGVFAADNDAAIRDKTILLCDDVLTTGATFDECADVLKNSKAAGVYCVSFCAAKKAK